MFSKRVFTVKLELFTCGSSTLYLSANGSGLENARIFRSNDKDDRSGPGCSKAG